MNLESVLAYFHFNYVLDLSRLTDTNIWALEICHEYTEWAFMSLTRLACMWEVYSLNLNNMC